MDEVWIKTEPVDGESSVYIQIKREDGISIVKTEPLRATVSLTTEDESPETVDIKSEITFGDYECTPQNFDVEFTKNDNQYSSAADKRFNCVECGAIFNTKFKLDDHKRKHTGLQ